MFQVREVQPGHKLVARRQRVGRQSWPNRIRGPFTVVIGIYAANDFKGEPQLACRLGAQNHPILRRAIRCQPP